MRAKAAAIASVAPQIDALLVPDSGDVVPALAAELAQGWRSPGTRCICSAPANGTIARILHDQALVGSWFPAPREEGFQSFRAKYQAAYGAPPPRNATLAYDATVLAAGLRAPVRREPLRDVGADQPERLRRSSTASSASCPRA